MSVGEEEGCRQACEEGVIEEEVCGVGSGDVDGDRALEAEGWWAYGEVFGVRFLGGGRGGWGGCCEGEGVGLGDGLGTEEEGSLVDAEAGGGGGGADEGIGGSGVGVEGGGGGDEGEEAVCGCVGEEGGAFEEFDGGGRLA